MAGHTLRTLAELAGGKVRGNPDFTVSGIAALDSAKKDEISFAVNAGAAGLVQKSGAGALILPENWPFEEKRPCILVPDPYLAFARIAGFFASKPFHARGIHQSAQIGEGCTIDPRVTICAGVVIGEKADIGEEVTIHPGVVIGSRVSIGRRSEIFPNVVIYEGCRIGQNVRIHAGAVIGADGFGYAQGPEGHVKIPQTGIVEIEDDVEIGANSTIDRATLGITRIGRGTKIDNLVMIAHNVTIGPQSIIVSQVGISGSTKVGAGVLMGGQVGIVGHVEIGDRARIGAKSGVAQSVPPGETVSGAPAIPHRRWLRMVNALKRLPDMVRDIRELKKRLENLEDGKG